MFFGIDDYITASVIIIVSFSILFFLLKKLKVIITPYGKANQVKRIFAAIIDILVCAMFYLSAVTFNDYSFYVITVGYILFRDRVFWGRSIGKIFLNIAAVKVEDGKLCSFKDSIMRNFIFVIPGFNVAAFIFEISLIIYHNKGIRLGDRLAKTQVVEGSEAPDYSESYQRMIFKDIFTKKVSEDDER